MAAFLYRLAVRTIATRIADTPGVVSVSPARFNPESDTALFTATPATAPTSEETKDLVRSIRAARPATGATFLVTGATAVEIDIAEKVLDALIPYLAIVLGLAFLLLLVVSWCPGYGRRTPAASPPERRYAPGSGTAPGWWWPPR